MLIITVFQHCSDFMVCTGSVVSMGQERKGSFWTFKGFHLKKITPTLDKTHLSIPSNISSLDKI